MKHLWLFGDSIRLNFQHIVARELAGRFTVHAPAENCRFAKYTFCMLPSWTKEFPVPDVIQWNNGIWDAGEFYGNLGVLTDPDEYIKETLRIWSFFKETGAKLIFATTTPVLPENDGGMDCRITPESIDRLNTLIIPELQKRGVYINDLSYEMKKAPELYIKEDGIHLSPRGMELCGNMTAAKILSVTR